MKPTGKIPIQTWMSAPQARQIMAAFAAANAQARFIGGCVRDSILKRPIRDIDIATPQPPQRVMEILEKAGIRAIPTGLSHGTITAVIDREHFEITTLRIDVETDGRRARVQFTDDWTQDAARRDFTINAMSCDCDGNIYDPYDGLKDLGRGYIRFVGNAKTRIEEDVLRLLRFFRFLAEYGKPPINGEALSACREMAPRLIELSGERVRGELFRILTATNTADTITKMRSERVLHYILPEAGEVGRLRMVAWLLEHAVKIDSITINPVRRLGALLNPDLSVSEVEGVARRLKFSNKERAHLLAITTPQPRIYGTMSETDLRRACQTHGGKIVVERALLSWAGELALEAHLAPKRTAAWTRLIETARDWTPIAFPLKGRDAINLGVERGPRIGHLLKGVSTWWQENDFKPNREACLDQLRTRIHQDS